MDPVCLFFTYSDTYAAPKDLKNFRAYVLIFNEFAGNNSERSRNGWVTYELTIIKNNGIYEVQELFSRLFIKVLIGKNVPNVVHNLLYPLKSRRVQNYNTSNQAE